MCREDIHYTEETLLKVFDALRRCHATEEQARDAIRGMQNAGILFRERGPNPYERPKTQIHRGNIFENFSELTRLPRCGEYPLVAGRCPTCKGTYRETVGMICPTCDHDYSQEER